MPTTTASAAAAAAATTTVSSLSEKKLFCLVYSISALDVFFNVITLYKSTFNLLTSLLIYLHYTIFTARRLSVVFAVDRCPSVRLSVCPSRWWIVSRWLKISSKVFLCPVAHHSSFFLTLRPYPIPRVTLHLGRKMQGVGKIGDFRRKPPFISETVRDRRMVTIWNVNRKSWVPDRMVSFSMTLSDP